MNMQPNSATPLTINQLQERIGYNFRNTKLLLIALTHPSCGLNGIQTNRRLEFLGDRVLALAVSEKLYDTHRAENEGNLTNKFNRMTCNYFLAQHAKHIGLGECLITPGNDRKVRIDWASLADAFEALVGAIKLDGGYDAARDFILREFESEFNNRRSLRRPFEPKRWLEELLQARSRPRPTYKEIARYGSPRNQRFYCAVICDDAELARGSGWTQKQAESRAAMNALAKLRTKQTRA